MSGGESARERLIRLLEASAGRAPQTPAEKLRAILTELEVRVANMAGTGSEVLAIPRLLDEATTLIEELEQAGLDVSPERTRLASVQGILREKAAVFVREARRGGGLAKWRAEVSPPPDRWWWYLDQAVAAQRRRRLARAAVVVLGVVVLLASVAWFIESRLPNDPRLRHIIELEQEVETALSEGRWQTAAQALEELRALDPENPEYAVTLGAVYEALGDQPSAEAAYAAARAQLPEARFYTLRAQAYLRVGLVDQALQDAQRATKLAPDDPEAFFYLGSAYEAKGAVPEALQAYEQAAALAESQNRVELLAVIRIRMAYLLQRPPLPTPETTPEQTP